MSVIKKLVTLLRGSAREIGQSVVDSNATRIYEQEIVDAKASIAEAKTELTSVMAKEMQSAREIERIQGDIRRQEDLALQALEKTEEGLALKVAERVAGLEAELQAQTASHAGFAVQVARLKDLIKAAEGRVREHYRATQSISDNIGSTGSKLTSARESLERIKKRHEDLADRMAAAEALEKEFGHKALDNELAAAGIGDNDKSRAQAVMARLRARQAAPASVASPVTGNSDTPSA